MAKYVNTTDDSLGAKQLKNGKLLVARKVDGRSVIEVIEDAKEIEKLIKGALPIIQSIIQALKDFFGNILQRFPSMIVEKDVPYVFTIQPSLGKGIDKVFYMSTYDANERIFEFEHKGMGKAKSMLFKALKNAGYK